MASAATNSAFAPRVETQPVGIPRRAAHLEATLEESRNESSADVPSGAGDEDLHGATLWPVPEHVHWSWEELPAATSTSHELPVAGRRSPVGIRYPFRSSVICHLPSAHLASGIWRQYPLSGLPASGLCHPASASKLPGTIAFSCHALLP